MQCQIDKIYFIIAMTLVSFSCLGQGIDSNVKTRAAPLFLQGEFYILDKGISRNKIFLAEYDSAEVLIHKKEFLSKGRYWSSYYENGIIESKGKFKRKYSQIRFFFRKIDKITYIKDGDWCYYDSYGSPIKKEMFIKGKLSSTSTP